MGRIRYAVVGAGRISQEAFIPSVAQTGNSEIAAIVSGSAEEARQLAEFYGIGRVAGYEEYDDLMASDLVDAVYIALPNSLHADFAIRALRAGRHAMVEKPLATSVAECEEMIAAAEASGALLMTAYRLHCDPGTVDLLKRVRSGEIGEPRLFSAVFSFQSRDDNHRLDPAHWGGPLQDIGIYCLNAARHVFGSEPVEAIAMAGDGDGDPRFARIAESVAATLRFPGGRLAQFIASFGADMIDSYVVAGTSGVLTLDPGFRYETDTALGLRREGAHVLERPPDSCDQFAGQVAYFSDCIVNGERPVADGAEGLADVRALLAIEEAARTGAPQRIGAPARQIGPGPASVRILPRTDRRLVLK